MTYLRGGDSDVFLYEDVYHGTVCMACSLTGQMMYVLDYVSYEDIAKHMIDHVRAGDTVPVRGIRNLEEREVFRLSGPKKRQLRKKWNRIRNKYYHARKLSRSTK